MQKVEKVRQRLIDELYFDLQQMSKELTICYQKWKAQREDADEFLFEELNGKYPQLLNSKAEAKQFFTVVGAYQFAVRYIESFSDKEIKEIFKSCS